MLANRACRSLIDRRTSKKKILKKASQKRGLGTLGTLPIATSSEATGTRMESSPLPSHSHPARGEGREGRGRETLQTARQQELGAPVKLTLGDPANTTQGCTACCGLAYPLGERRVLFVASHWQPSSLRHDRFIHNSWPQCSCGGCGAVGLPGHICTPGREAILPTRRV